MALINCSFEAQEVIIPAGSTNVASMVLTITPNEGFVVAASDFEESNTLDPLIIQSLTFSNSEVTGGPLNDGAYSDNNTVLITVDFVDAYAFAEDTTIDIEPVGSAVAKHLVPVLVQGTFAVPGSPVKTTFTPSSVVDYLSSVSTTDFSVLGTPGSEVELMTMTIDATAGDFIDEDPTIAITNVSDTTASLDYTHIARTNTYDSELRLTQVIYVITITLPKVSRSDDLITFTGAGEDLPSISSKIYNYEMDTTPTNLGRTNRRLEIYGDEGSEFRIKMERGSLSGSTFTIDTTDGIYVFDNTRETTAEAFEPSTSTTTYPSEIQSDGTYDPATDPYEINSSGVFYKDIIIPEDTDPGGGNKRAYRFTIIPQNTTTIDLNAPDINTTPDPDEITFTISSRTQVDLDATYDTTRTTTDTIEYFDHNGDSLGSTAPSGLDGEEANQTLNTYSYNIVITDTVTDFYLPNDTESYTLINQNYTSTLNNGLINEPTVIADIRAYPSGFNHAKMSPVGQASHTAADAIEPTVDIVITDKQRKALTNMAGFSAESFNDSFAVSGASQYFKIYFWSDITGTMDYVSQTIHIYSDFQVEGGADGQQNTTSIASPPLDREKLYITGTGLTIREWGDSDMDFQHDLNTFTYTAAPASNNTLTLSFGITQGLKKYINDILRSVSYVNDPSYSIAMTTSTDGVTFAKENITTSTTHVQFAISGAFLTAEDALPVDFNTSDYTLAVEVDPDNSFEADTIEVIQPTVTLTNGSDLNRNLAIATMYVTFDFGVNLNPAVITEDYFFNAQIIHRLSDQYKVIDIAEQDAVPEPQSTPLASY